MTLDTELGIIKLEDEIEDVLLEFKLVDRDSLLLCDKEKCRYRWIINSSLKSNLLRLCTLNVTCTELKRERRFVKNDLQFASAVKDGQKYFIELCQL